MRRTPRTEFQQSREAADRARRELLQRVRPDRETAPPVGVEPAPTSLVDVLRAAIAGVEQAQLSQLGRLRAYHRAIAVGMEAQAERDRVELVAFLRGDPGAELSQFGVRPPVQELGRFDFLLGSARWQMMVEPAPDVLADAVQAMNARAAEIRAAGGYVATEGDPLDRHSAGGRGPVRARYSPVVWPDEGYPCQLCWAVGRWPWEPMRSCPADVDPVSTYCVDHGGKAAPPRAERPVARSVFGAFVRDSVSGVSRGLFQVHDDLQAAGGFAAGDVVRVRITDVTGA